VPAAIAIKAMCGTGECRAGSHVSSGRWIPACSVACSPLAIQTTAAACRAIKATRRAPYKVKIPRSRATLRAVRLSGISTQTASKTKRARGPANPCLNSR
jgi:hypothetical protein